MHILYIHQHFAIPKGATGTRSYEFARRWVQKGHQVTVITGHYDIGGLDYSSTPQYIKGIKIIIAGNRYSNKQSFLRRVWSFLGFIWYAFVAGLKQKNVDIIFATSTPLTIGVSAMLLKIFKRIPFIFEVRDQWPAVPIALGIIKNPMLKRALSILEKKIYISASAIVALSPGMAAGVNDVLGHIEREIVISPNSCDLAHFHPGIDSASIREKRNWCKKKIFLHSGAMGEANGLDFIIDAAIKLRDISEIHFVIIGEGKERERLLTRVDEEKLDNVEMLGSIPKLKLPGYFSAADVSMVIFANHPILEHNSANKFFDSLSAGKPVIINYSGWQRDLLESHAAGFGCKQCDLDVFVDRIKTLAKNPELLINMGNEARKLGEKKFSRDLLSDRVISLLEKVYKNNREFNSRDSR